MEKQTVEKVEKTKGELIAETVAGKVKQYNDLEAQAFKVLTEIFYDMKKGGGYRRIRFSNGTVLTNCWGLPDHRDYDQYLKIYARGIESIEPGH